MKYMMAGASTRTAIAACLVSLFGWGQSAQAQNYPVTPAQQATASQVAQQGVPIADLAPNAPDTYTVKSGDTLWGISGIFLNRPWRWPELWGMNLQDIRNPHLIYPGQRLFLDKRDGRAMLRTASLGDGGTIRVSPRTRYESLLDNALTTLPTNLIEAFLSEPLIIDEATLTMAPRIVATQDGRVLISRGDRAYARGSAESPLSDAKGQPRDFRVFRSLQESKDVDSDGKRAVEIVPATIDFISSKEESRVGDRLLPEPPRELLNYVPRAPSQEIDGRIVSIYGSAVANAAQSQIVVINRGTKDGIERGHVLTLLSDGGTQVDKTDPSKPVIKLPDERNGLLMVFRPFERLSYGLIMQINSGVKVGDRLSTPR
jgi:hypothetical protein